MNLGNAALRSVSHSRPQLLHSDSKQSVTASDDYWSLSEHASDVSVADEKHPNEGWKTPPSRTISPATNDESHDLDAPIIIPPMRSPRRQPAPIYEEKMETVTQGSQTPRQRSAGQGTPGIDDTPYIRFAVDQITRDEEITGRGRNSRVSEASYPVERIIPTENVTSYTPSAILPPPEPPQEPIEEYPDYSETYQPVNIRHNSFRYPALNYVPPPLHFISVGLFLIVILLMMAGLIFCAVWSKQKHGLWDYAGIQGGRYFVFQFLPQILALIILFWMWSVEAALYRILPFAAMASPGKGKSNAFLMELYPTNYLFPSSNTFRSRNPMLLLVSIVFRLMNFSVPLQSTLFTAQLIGSDGSAKWIWVTVQPVAWTLVALYALLAMTVLAILVLYLRPQTGLKWDPTSLADIAVLLRRSNAVEGFQSSEMWRTGADFRSRLPVQSAKLGYWRTSANPNDLFYAIAEEGSSPRRYSLRQGKVQEVRPESKGGPGRVSDIEAQWPLHSSLDSFQAEIHSKNVRFRHVPWFLRTPLVIVWICIVLALLIAFIVASFVDSALYNGFKPLIGSAPDNAGFSAANFLYSFVPSLIGMFFCLVWQSIDMHFRVLQPFADMMTPRGAIAETTVLLDYPSCQHIEVIVKAAAAGHYKVAWISFVSLVSAVLPIIGGGLFWAELFVDDNQIRMAAQQDAFHALVAFAIVYALSSLVIFPTSKRYLPHGVTTLAEMISFLYESPLLYDEAFREPKTKTELVTKLISAPPGENAKPTYGFGIYRGRDGLEHLGIDRAQRPGMPVMLVTSGHFR